MSVLIRLTLLLGGCLLAPLSFAEDLTGYWKIDNHPAWIEIKTDGASATGTVRRNDENPDAVGRVLLKNVVADSGSPGVWRGQIYAARLGEYKDAEITLLDSARVQIMVALGFMSRTINWTRVTEIP